METMEATKNKAEESNETWYFRVFRTHGDKQLKGILVCICNKYTGHYQEKN